LLFLEEDSVAPTNNHAERTLRFAVLWRKRSQETRCFKGRWFVERILSLRQTCRLNAKPTYPVLVDAVSSFFSRETPQLGWIEKLAAATL
jgi:transposase